MSIEEQFEKFKVGFIINNFADNIYFNTIANPAIKRIEEPYAPELNIWTAQPINAIKTQNHL
jgi:hypothetical protein